MVRLHALVAHGPLPDAGPATMSEPAARPEPSPAEESGLRRTARTVWTGVGCLALLVGTVLVGGAALVSFLAEPVFWIALIALFAVGAALKAGRGGR